MSSFGMWRRMLWQKFTHILEAHTAYIFRVQISKQRKQPARRLRLRPLTACFPGLFFYPEDEGNTFLRNIHESQPDYTVSYPRKRYSIVTTVRNLSSKTSCHRIDAGYSEFLHGPLPVSLHVFFPHLCVTLSFLHKGSVSISKRRLVVGFTAGKIFHYSVQLEK
jgi:hypothetical protein